MEVGIISMRYAKALIGYARELKAEERIYDEVATLSHSFETQPKLREAIDSPVLPLDEKQQLIRIAAVGDQEASPAFIRFIHLVLKQRRESYLQFICLMYMDLYRKLKHIGVAKLTTSVPVSKAVEAKIQEAASKRLHAKMELLTAVDPEIGGGFIFDINGYRLDASVSTQLKRVKQQIIDKNKRIV
jgi:F-type H+-transporting ATPase subunit delta